MLPGKLQFILLKKSQQVLYTLFYNSEISSRFSFKMILLWSVTFEIFGSTFKNKNIISFLIKKEL